MDNMIPELDLSDHAFLEKRMGKILKQRKSSISSENKDNKCEKEAKFQIKAFLRNKMSKHSQKKESSV